MIIIPSLDIQQGKSKYSYEGSTEPVEIIKALKKKGFHHFFITDLDGVFSGEFACYNLIKELKTEDVFLYVSGGIRSFDVAAKVIDLGANAIVVGTSAIKDQELLMNLIDTYGDFLCVSIDTYEESVFIEGWVEDSDVDVTEFISSMALLGVKRLIHTEINHTNNLTICSNQTMQKLSNEHCVQITPSIDITNPVILEEFIRCGCHDVIVGGSMDLIDLENYKHYNV